jgi:hypothetical protein
MPGLPAAAVPSPPAARRAVTSRSKDRAARRPVEPIIRHDRLRAREALARHAKADNTRRAYRAGVRAW